MIWAARLRRVLDDLNNAQECIHENKGLLRPLDESVPGAKKPGRSAAREQPIEILQLAAPS